MNKVRQNNPLIIIALDYDNETDALDLCNKLSPADCRLKIGKQLFTKYGPDIIKKIQNLGFEIFLDLKFHDIPTTVHKACLEAYKLGVWMLNVHLLGGRDMIMAAKEARDSINPKLNLIGVTLLTSHNHDDLKYFNANTRQEVVQNLSEIAIESEIDGVVCSPGDIEIINKHKNSLKFITPGIRLNDVSNEHAKTYTPESAINLGSSYLVIGRPITEASDPMLVINQINSNI